MEWVKILSGAGSARMLNRDHHKFVSLARSDTRPGDGWWPVEKVLPKPEVPDGDELAYTYTVRDGVAYKEYMLASSLPQQPKTYVTADVIEALMMAGVWSQVRAFIEERGMLDMVLATKEFRADDPNFTGPRDALQTALGWTDEQVEAVLAASVKGGA